MTNPPGNSRRGGFDRRQMLATAALTAGLPGIAAGALLPTPRQTTGPFYPETMPADSDSDLTRVGGRGQMARGVPLRLSGQIVSPAGDPVPRALVEIWQCDANGRYHHRGDHRAVPRDPGFQGYGRTRSGGQGEYRFRTIRPVPYPGRAPHIHFAVTAPGLRTFVTQMYVAGEPGNATDFLFNALPSEADRHRLLVTLKPSPTPDSELLGHFKIVLPQS